MIPSVALAALIMTASASVAAASEYSCVRGDQAEQRVEVVAEGPAGSAPCEVVYWTNTDQLGVRNVLWNAQTDAAFCRRKAEELVGKLERGGWSCTTAESANKKATREAGAAVAAPGPVRPGAGAAHAPESVRLDVTRDEPETKPDTAAHGAPVLRAALAPGPPDSQRGGSAEDEDEPRGGALEPIIEQNLVRLNEGVEGQFAAGIGGYGDLNDDGLEDGLVFFTYESERLAQARVRAPYSKIEAIENGVVSTGLGIPEPDDPSCCPSDPHQQRLVLRDGQLVEVGPPAGPSPSSSATGTMDGSTGGTTSSRETSSTSSSNMPGCLGTFAGPLTKLDQDYGYTTTKIATWPSQARFDARGGKWESYMDGHYADDQANRRNTAPIQLGADWGTNVNGAGRTDVWFSHTPLNTNPLCFYGGLVVGTQLEGATWGETKMDGGGYAITINSKDAVVEGMRIHNHHDGFVPYRSDGFTYRGNWQSYTRDDCIENDAGAAGTVTDNLFDGCFVFFSNSGGPAGEAAGSSGTLRITNNLIKMAPMPGPPHGRAGVEHGNPSIKAHGVLFKVQRKSEDALPQLILRDNVIAYAPSGAKNTLKSLGRIAARQSTFTSQCSNNTILWLGSGPFPYEIPNNVRECFNIIIGIEAQQRWQQERQAWIDTHPEIPRI